LASLLLGVDIDEATFVSRFKSRCDFVAARLPSPVAVDLTTERRLNSPVQFWIWNWSS
jgi:hypothetical protein